MTTLFYKAVVLQGEICCSSNIGLKGLTNVSTDWLSSSPMKLFSGRFEEGVIEERRKAALELLNFAGNIPDLFTSQPFVKFFEVM